MKIFHLLLIVVFISGCSPYTYKDRYLEVAKKDQSNIRKTNKHILITTRKKILAIRCIDSGICGSATEEIDVGDLAKKVGEKLFNNYYSDVFIATVNDSDIQKNNVSYIVIPEVIKHYYSFERHWLEMNLVLNIEMKVTVMNAQEKILFEKIYSSGDQRSERFMTRLSSLVMLDYLYHDTLYKMFENVQVDLKKIISKETHEKK